MEVVRFYCFKCGGAFFSPKQLIRHIKVSYPYISNFLCKQNFCTRSFSNLSSLNKHLSCHAAKEIKSKTRFNLAKKDIDTKSTVANNEGSSLVKPESFVESKNIRNAIVKNIAKFYSNPSFSRNIVHDVISYSEELLNELFMCITNICHPDSNKSNLEIFSEIQSFSLDVKNIFTKLQSEHLRIKHFKSISYIEPKSIKIGSTSSLSRISSTTPPDLILKNANVQKICIKTKLKEFLQIPGVLNDILDHIKTELSSTIITSIYQGNLWKSLQPIYLDKTVFPLLLFFDDLEPCNVLGSRAGLYKIGTVYISLACIPTEYASLLENIFLAQLFYSDDRQAFGNAKVFSSLIDDLIFLEEHGISVVVNNREYKIYFSLLLILGDNLGLNSILGFTESFNADYFCRACLLPKNSTKHEVYENTFQLRTPENYEVDSLNLTHGVKEKCVWHRLPNFHVTKNISLDLMHDMLEGILRYDLAFIIDDLITKKYFSLNVLNNRIKFFKFSKVDKGNPIPQIKLDHLKKKHIIMSAAEMLALTSYFGILVGDLISDHEQSWTLYTLIREILDILLSRTFNLAKIEYLEVIIQEHHMLFCELFGEHLRPKFHILLHYPKMILTIGPPRNIWCMRYESYHKLLKTTANSTTCRKNLLLTLSIKDSLRFSYRVLSKTGFSNTPKFGPAIINGVSEFLVQHNLSLKLKENCFLVNWLSINSVFLKIGLALLTDQNNILPLFERIERIIVNDKIVYFVVSPLETMGYNIKAQAYEILSSNCCEKLLMCSFDKLCGLSAFSIKFTGDGKTVISLI